MANVQNLKPYSKDNPPPANRRSRKGVPNRATILKRWLDAEVLVKNKTVDKQTGEEKISFPDLPDEFRVTAYELAALGIIKKAMQGDVAAFREIQDSLFGKMPDKIEFSVSPEILAARQLFEELVAAGCEQQKALKKALETARRNGTELTADDILNADCIG